MSSTRAVANKATSALGVVVLVSVLVGWVAWPSPDSALPLGPTRTGREAAENSNMESVGRTLLPTSRLGLANQIGGRVIDREEGPLAEGTVELGCEDGTTLGRAAIDEDGTFVGPACAEGDTCARLVHPGSVQSGSWRLRIGEPLDLDAQPSTRIAGRIEADDEPVPAAVLIARRGSERWQTTSDAEGEFVIALGTIADSTGDSICSFAPSSSSDRIALLVQAPTHRAWASTIDAAGDDDLTITLRDPVAPLLGTLLDREARAFDRTRVIAHSRERTDEAHSTVPEPDGHFEFAALGDGRYDLRAIRDGVELGIGQGSGGESVNLATTFSARGPTLALECQDADQQPLVGVRVDGGPFRGARSDDQGRVTATDVLPGVYELRVRVPGCGVSRERIEVGSDDPRGTLGSVPGSMMTIRRDLSGACDPP